ncbi:unnamed protein product [Caenorhabditis angaria]|uniref:Uncharacterized protein n=1 Tax=Caenorhabditis angaria TaxID=860376 RepID=A0A9P1IC87_9PELO|nr:unnamed protein product [Caenorhabditis angaria]
MTRVSKGRGRPAAEATSAKRFKLNDEMGADTVRFKKLEKSLENAIRRISHLENQLKAVQVDNDKLKMVHR